MRAERAKIVKWIAAAVVLAAVITLAFTLPLKEWLEPFERWADDAGLWGMCVFVLVYAGLVVLFVPGSLLTIGAGFALGFGKALPVAWLGATLGATLAFLVARHVFRARIEALAKKNAKFEAIDHAISEQGWKVVALLRLSPLLPYNLSNYLYGVTRVELPQYVAASCIGMLPGTILHVYLGSLGNEASHGGAAGTWKWILSGIGVIATAAVTVWISRLARRALKSMPHSRSGEAASS